MRRALEQELRSEKIVTAAQMNRKQQQQQQMLENSGGADAAAEIHTQQPSSSLPPPPPTPLPPLLPLLEKEEEEELDEMDVVMRSMSAGSTNMSVLDNSHRQPQLRMLQQQLRLAETGRDVANEQLVRALAAAERAPVLEAEVQEARRRLDVALEVLGERQDQIEALEEDVRDMKAIFHEQLSIAADQLVAARSATGTGAAAAVVMNSSTSSDAT